MACQRCYDPRPVWLDPPHIDPREGAPIAHPRFEEPVDPGTFIDPEINPIDPADYPKSF